MSGSDESDLRDRIRLARTDGVGPVTYRRLLREHTPADAIAVLPNLAARAGRATRPRVPSIGDIEREMERVHKLGGRMLVLGGPDYPPLLALLGMAPPVLTVLGDVSALSVRAVALVGARNASAPGQRMAEALAAELPTVGLDVISGLARGIDAAAHTGAMHTGRTVAAVAGGIDVVYPPEHATLQRRITERGAVVAEAPFGTAPQARHFPRRDRVIAGLSLGVIVIEAALRSGSLITAQDAHDMDRMLFAVPGSPLDPRCRGSNDLIRQGAALTESAADVLAHLPEMPGRTDFGLAELQAAYDIITDPVEVRQKLLQLIGFSPCPVDDLVRRCQFSTGAIVAGLSDLEMLDQIETLPGNQVCRIATAADTLQRTL